MSREYTDRLIEMLQDGLIDAESLVQDLLGWLSEDEVKEFAERLVQDLLGWLSEDEVKEFAERNDYITEEDEE